MTAAQDCSQLALHCQFEVGLLLVMAALRATLRPASKQVCHVTYPFLTTVTGMVAPGVKNRLVYPVRSPEQQRSG